jgi:hypothetical protein
MPAGLLLASGKYYAGGDLGTAFDAARKAVSTRPKRAQQRHASTSRRKLYKNNNAKNHRVQQRQRATGLRNSVEMKGIMEYPRLYR